MKKGILRLEIKKNVPIIITKKGHFKVLNQKSQDHVKKFDVLTKNDKRVNWEKKWDMIFK